MKHLTLFALSSLSPKTEGIYSLPTGFNKLEEKTLRRFDQIDLLSVPLLMCGSSHFLTCSNSPPHIGLNDERMTSLRVTIVDVNGKKKVLLLPPHEQNLTGLLQAANRKFRTHCIQRIELGSSLINSDEAVAVLPNDVELRVT